MAKVKTIFTYLIFIACVFAQILPLVRSGLSYPYGIGFWGPNGHDAVWHLSLINHITTPTNIPMPIYAGQKLTNYHPFYDILIHYLNILTHLPTSILYFQVFPVISTILFLYLSYRLGGTYLLLLNTFANSLGWIVTLIKSGSFAGETVFWSMQSPSNQINPPYILSIIFLLQLLLILKTKYKTGVLTIQNSLTIFLILVLLPVTKVYGAIIGFSLYSVFTIYHLYIHKKFSNLWLLIFSIITSYYLFSVYNQNASSLLVFQPFWFIDSMFTSPDRLFFPIFSRLLFGPHRLIFELFGIGVFIIGNFGFRLLGFFQKKIYSDFYYLSIIFSIFIATLLPILFIQKGTNWNTIQFVYYALILSNILFAQILPQLSKLVVIFIFSTYFLTYIATSPNYLGKIPPAALPYSELNALQFLKQQPPGAVLTYPYDPHLRSQFTSTPLPLYAYETSSYVSAYSTHSTFLEDEMNLQNSGYDVNLRRQASLAFFKQENIYQDRGFLVNNDISYIYLAGLQLAKTSLNTQDLYIVPLYNQDNVVIYKVLK
ncbi:MAG: hypothetical protein WAV41_04870 [Microgenomates group bacterium]